VDYVFVPAADNRRLGLVHDHAYWVSGLRVRAGARGEISAVSSVPPPGPGRPGDPFGRAGDPVVAPVDSWNGDAPQPETVVGSDWSALPNVPRGNRLRLRLDNVGRARIDGARAGLTGRRCLHVTIESDGPARVALALRLPSGARTRKGNACRGSAPIARNVALGRRGGTFAAATGTHSWVILAE